jgi:hypothetical protein
MGRYGTLGDYRFLDTQEAALDIRGAKIFGLRDQELGQIDDVVFDEATGAIVYIVVDTGGWLSSKKFIVPPQEVRPSLQHQDDFLVELTKEQVESFPAYDEAELSSEERWADYEKRYRSKWVESPVMHREASDRNLTPPTEQQVAAGSEATSSSDDTAELDARELEAATELTPIHIEGTMEVSASGPSLRWSAFEDSLRQRREDVLQSSIENAKRNDEKKAADVLSAEEWLERRKAG